MKLGSTPSASEDPQLRNRFEWTINRVPLQTKSISEIRTWLTPSEEIAPAETSIREFGSVSGLGEPDSSDTYNAKSHVNAILRPVRPKKSIFPGAGDKLTNAAVSSGVSSDSEACSSSWLRRLQFVALIPMVAFAVIIRAELGDRPGDWVLP